MDKVEFRINCYIPPAQLFGSFQSLLKVFFLGTAKLDALLVNGIEQAGDGAHAFPAKIAGPIDDRIHRTEQVAVP